MSRSVDAFGDLFTAGIAEDLEMNVNWVLCPTKRVQ